MLSSNAQRAVCQKGGGRAAEGSPRDRETALFNKRTKRFLAIQPFNNNTGSLVG